MVKKHILCHLLILKLLTISIQDYLISQTMMFNVRVHSTEAQFSSREERAQKSGPSSFLEEDLSELRLRASSALLTD